MSHADKPIIEVRGLWKRYGLPPFLPWKKRIVQDNEWALKDISFSVPRGGSLGILGRNGAGKSTLLKLLAGVTPPDKGEIIVRGKIFPMIELTAGMSMELSGRENIRILGTIMGLSGKEIERIIPEVEDFSELEDWIYKPVWQYSSGMVARLAFAIAVHMRADILLVDEVLATGDIMFQKKCHLKVQEMLAGGTTLVLVSHSPYQAERLCDDAMLLERGSLAMLDTSTSVMHEYLNRTVENGSFSTTNGVQRLKCLAPELRPGTGDIRFTGARIQSDSNLPDNQVKTGETITIILEYEAKSDIKNFNFNATINNAVGAPIALLGILPHEKIEVLPRGHGEITCLIDNFPLLGRFFLSATMKTTYLLDRAEYLTNFTVLATADEATRTAGVGDIYMKPKWNFLSHNNNKPSKTQNFETPCIEPNEIKIYKYEDPDGNFDYKKYKEVQIATNIRKLKLSSIDSRDIEMLSSWLIEHISPLRNGICHGARNGKEQLLFRKFTKADVWGTDISPTANQFPYSMQHDFHEIKPEWINHFDFIFSNSYDHSYNLELCIRQWMKCIRPGGVCILDHSNGYLNAKESDPIGITKKAFCRLISHWGQDSFSIKTEIPAVEKNGDTDSDFKHKNQVFIVVEKSNQ